MSNLRKMEITIDFNGNLGHLCGVINQLVNVTETFTDILKHYFLKMNAVRDNFPIPRLFHVLSTENQLSTETVPILRILIC